MVEAVGGWYQFPGLGYRNGGMGRGTSDTG